MRIEIGIVALLLTVGLVGCGGNDGGSSVASANGSASSPTSSASAGSGSEQDQLLRYARCMREHGVPNFPDPDEDGGFALDGLGIDPDGPAMRAAQQACGMERGRTVPPGATVHD